MHNVDFLNINTKRRNVETSQRRNGRNGETLKMPSKEIIVSIKIIGDSPLRSSILKKLNPDDYLSDTRKVLENNNAISDTLSFIKKGSEESVVDYEDEKNFRLK